MRVVRSMRLQIPSYMMDNFMEQLYICQFFYNSGRPEYQQRYMEHENENKGSMVIGLLSYTKLSL